MQISVIFGDYIFVVQEYNGGFFYKEEIMLRKVMYVFLVEFKKFLLSKLFQQYLIVSDERIIDNVLYDVVSIELNIEVMNNKYSSNYGDFVNNNKFY